MDNWLTQFREAIATEYADRPPVLALATAGLADGGGPRVRMMICRRIDDAGRIYLTTDSRSAKFHELHRRAQAEAVFWLTTLRRQYRITGRARLLTRAEESSMLEIWRELPPPTRATFFWPSPGTPADEASESNFPREIAADVEPPDTFALLVLDPASVEELDLRPHPHRCRRWSAISAWRAEPLNP